MNTLTLEKPTKEYFEILFGNSSYQWKARIPHFLVEKYPETKEHIISMTCSDCKFYSEFVELKTEEAQQ